MILTFNIVQGVDSNYCDKQGFTLLHLVCVPLIYCFWLSYIHASLYDLLDSLCTHVWSYRIKVTHLLWKDYSTWRFTRIVYSIYVHYITEKSEYPKEHKQGKPVVVCGLVVYLFVRYRGYMPPYYLRTRLHVNVSSLCNRSSFVFHVFHVHMSTKYKQAIMFVFRAWTLISGSCWVSTLAYLNLLGSWDWKALLLVNFRLHYLTRLRLPLFSWTMEQMFKAKMGKVGSFYEVLFKPICAIILMAFDTEVLTSKCSYNRWVGAQKLFLKICSDSLSFRYWFLMILLDWMLFPKEKGRF